MGHVDLVHLDKPLGSDFSLGRVTIYLITIEINCDKGKR